MIKTILDKINVCLIALIFGSSIGVLFSVLTNINIAKHNGIAVKVAANNNAPIFIAYSKMLLVLGVLFLLVSLIKRKLQQGIQISLPIILCVIAIFIFSLYISPQMDLLRPSLSTSNDAKTMFENLHKISQIDFGLVIITSLICLIQLPTSCQS